MTTLERTPWVTVIDLSADVDIDRPAAAAWAVVADYRRDPQWRRGVRRMAPSPAGPVTVGTTTDEVLRLAGSTYRNRGEVTAMAPGSAFAWHTTAGADADGSRTVTPLTDDRCRVRLTLTVRASGMQRLIAPLLSYLLQRNLSGDAERLRELVERSEPT